MSKTLNRTMIVILLCIVSVITQFQYIALADDQDHYVSAVSRISIYHQYLQNNGKYWNYISKQETYWDTQLWNNYQIKISEGDGSTPYICGRGCNLLAFAHAAQWFEGAKASDSHQIEILYQLLKRNRDAPNAQSEYLSYLKSTYGIKSSYKSGSLTESDFKATINKGGYIVFSSNGHVAGACGYRTINGTLNVLIVDSTCYSTLKRLPDKGSSAKTWELTSMSDYANGNNYSGGQYWVPFSQFKGLKWYYLLTPADLPEVPAIQNATCPESISNGSSFDLRGTINCKYTMTNIQGVIYNCTTGTKLFDVSVAPDSNSYTLGASGEAISSGLKFNDSSLYDSWCRFELKVTYDKNGETCIKRVHDRYFSVGSPSSMTLHKPGVYQFVCDDESRSAPGEGNSIVNNYSKGSIVFAVGYEYKTNVWLVLTDGSYVFSGDVDRVTWAENDISGSLTFLSSGTAETYPYANGPDYQQYDAGSQVTVIAQLTNTEGEVWYKIADGSYVYSGNVEYKNNCNHPDVEITTIKEAYLGEYGLRQKQCAVCGEIIETWAYYEDIPVLTNSNFILPSSIKHIEEEAFEGIPAAYINLKCCNVESIGKRAFANCENLLQIFIPRTVVSIDEDAFGEKTDFMIFGYSGTKAESFAKKHGIQFIIMDVYGWWEPVEYFPDNETMDQVKTQYRYRDKVTAGGYTEWSEWSAWSNTQQSITADDLMQEESKLRYYWWAAQCTSCGHNNPYHGSSSKCYNCGITLANNQGLWKTVEKYTDDYSGTQTIHGRSGGRYFDGIPYWNDSEKQVTQFRYRTRDYLIGWSDWSAWSDAIAYPSDTREVETRIMGHVQGD